MKSFILRTFLFTTILLTTNSDAFSWSVTIGGVNYNVEVSGYGADAVPLPASVARNYSFSGDLVIPPTITFDYTYALKDSDGNYVKDSNGNYIYNTRRLTTPVTNIIYEAFKSTDVTSVTIGSNVKSIKSYAFNSCNKMQSLSVPSSVETIGEGAFTANSLTDLYWNVIDPNGNGFDGSYNMTGGIRSYNLEHVTFGPNVKVVPAHLLEYSKVTDIVIPNSVTSIGGYAFRGASQLRTIVFGNSVTEIGHDAFINCISLEEIVFPSTMASIGSRAFLGCTSLTDVTFNINSSLSLDFEVFKDCSSLRHITLPNKISSIPAGAFKGCSSLTEINIPHNVTYISAHAFEDCSSMSSLTVGTAVSSIGQDAFNNCYGLTQLYWYAKDCTVDHTTTGIGFIYSRNIENVTIGTGVETLPYGFVRFAKIKTLTIPKSVKTINDYTFSDCTELRSVYWNAENATIRWSGASPFLWCNNLTQFIIGKDVKAIGDKVFSIIDSDNHVDSVICLATVPPSITKYCFVHGQSVKTYKNATLYVPEGALETYRNAEGWKEFTNIKKIEHPVASGDVDSDGSISIADVVALIDLIISRESIEDNPCADVDGDDSISIADVVALIDMILGNR